jgi:hypothetical protein
MSGIEAKGRNGLRGIATLAAMAAGPLTAAAFSLWYVLASTAASGVFFGLGCVRAGPAAGAGPADQGRS